jgi:hypothetical protein
MAHTFCDTGLSALLAAFPSTATAQPTAWWIGFFGSQTSGTVPSRTAFEGATPGGWVESVAVARINVSASYWNAGAVNGNGVRSTGAQVAVTATAAGSANGYFLSNRPTAGAGSVTFAFANFDDLTTISYNSGDVIRLTPAFQFNVSALS